MTSIISVLPDHVANQIAAGEVVQRPASVVKELLENSIDAGATKITLSIVGAGKTSILVSDNGTGMGEEDAERCFQRHATSKIKSADDLFNLSTRGFRGEAMASIGAVAHVSLRTKGAEDGLGLELALLDGSVATRAPYPMPQGTTVEVKNLFYNVPARRKFLKNDRIELRHCIDEFHRVALVHTQIEWVFKSDGKLLFHLQPESSRRRISAIFGRKFDEKLVPIAEDTEVVKVEGFVMKPEFAKKKRGEQFFFVNGRFIKSPYLHNALREAFEEVLTAEHHPGYFLFLQVEPSALDVNIHPTKTEVKFEDERAIYAVLRSAARHAIGQFNVAPAIDFDAETTFQVPPAPKGYVPPAPQISVNPNFNPFDKNSIDRPQLRTPDEQYERIRTEQALNASSVADLSMLSEQIDASWNDEQDLPGGNQPILLWGQHALTVLRSTLLIIDLKAARVRILYDQLWEKLEHATVASQQLLFPVEMELSLKEREILEQHATSFAVAGFDWELATGGEVVHITGIPVILETEQARSAMEQLMDAVEHTEEVQSGQLLKVFARELATAGSKGPLPKSQEELKLVKEQLLSSSNPQFTPHGKRIISELSPEQLVTLL